MEISGQKQLRILRSKFRRKIKKSGLNIWTYVETAQDKKGILFDMFFEILERSKRIESIKLSNCL